MNDIFRNLDECITDACAFLELSRSTFFELAEQWPEHDRRFIEYDDPTEFYQSWQGDIGRSNLCANILDQTARFELTDVIRQLPNSSIEGDPLSLADVGCASAAQTFPHVERFDRVHLLDLPNLNQEFVAWRCKKRGYEHVGTGSLEDIEEPVHIMICFDVLEHIANSSEFFRVMDSKLRPDGLLLLRTPWYSMVPHIEHLPEAEESWKKQGGENLLADQYKTLHPLEYGGVYQKKKS